MAEASSSVWYETDGARLRILTSGQPDGDGRLQGALEIDLKPGWKTYWRDPGASGVPPSIDISRSVNVASLDMSYPAPDRFDDESGSWVGYKHSVMLPVSFRVAAGQPVEIAADVFIGVCEAVCVPVQATFSLDPAIDADNLDHAAAIQNALAQIPSAAQPDFGVTLLSANDKQIVLSAAFPGSKDKVGFFLAGVDGYMFGAPVQSEMSGKVVFIVPILDKPAEKPAGAGLPYTLVTQAGAVDGVVPFP